MESVPSLLELHKVCKKNTIQQPSTDNQNLLIMQ